jgi:membrane protein YdbS with pleckstrin-like domain
MYRDIEEPEHRISTSAVKVWRLSNTIGHGIAFFIIAVLLGLDHLFEWWNWIDWVLYGLTVIAFLSAIYSIFIEPALLQRTWRYGVDEEYVQLKHGVLTRVHVLVPMTKVEYVKTNQGPLMRKFGMYNVEIGTMASSHSIPAVSEKEALALRAQIAQLAKIKDGE